MTRIKSNNNLILTKRDITLIKNSEEVKKVEIYGNLYDCLESYTTLSPKDLQKDIVFDDKARLALNHNIKTMMKHVEGEWYAKTSSQMATQETHCQLCGAKNIYVCYIVNRTNGKELHVGTECIKKYKDIYGADVAISKLKAGQRDTKKEERRSTFDVALGENIDFTKTSDNKVETFPIILPYKLHTQLKQTIKDCNRIRTSYVSSGGDLDECISKYNSKITEFDKLYKDAESYYAKNANNPLICTREIGDWLKVHHPDIIPKIQKAKSILNEDTLQYIHEPNFIRKNLPIFERCIKDNDVTFLGINGDVIRFKIANDRFIQPIYFTMPISGFMKNIGCHCLTQSGYKFSKSNLSPSVENNASNLRNVFNYFTGILSNTGYNIILEEKTSQLYWEKRQSIIANKWSRRAKDTNTSPIYKLTQIEKVLNIMSYILLIDKPEKEISKAIINKVSMDGKWISKEEKDRNIQFAHEAAGMQKQKEFTPYS